MECMFCMFFIQHSIEKVTKKKKKNDPKLLSNIIN